MTSPDAVTDEVADETRVCHICGREVVPCDECDGARIVDNEPCEDCDGTGEGCPVHHAEWQRVGPR